MSSESKDEEKNTIIPDSSNQRDPFDKLSDPCSSNCNTHKTEVIQAFCEQCQKAVCMDCIISGTHQNHHLQKIGDAIEKNVNELEKILTSSEQNLINYTELLSEFQIIKENYSISITECINKIKNRNDELKKELDQATDIMIQQVKHIEEEYNEQLEQQETLVQLELSSLKELIQKSKMLSKTKTIKILKYVGELKQKLEKFQSFDTPQQACPPDFVAKEANVVDIFGSLDLEEEKASDFEMSLSPPISNAKVLKRFSTLTPKNIVVTFNGNLAWLGKCGQGDVTMVTESGLIIDEIKTDFDVYDLAVTKNEHELLATTFQSNKVKKLKGEKTFIDLYAAPKYHNAKGITVTNENNILVCYDNVDTCEGKVLKLSPDGQVLNTIKYDADGKTLLFRYPYRITSNVNGDIIVTASSDNILTGLDKSGKRRFAYSGDSKVLKRKFVPHGITTDADGDIIISDYYNSAIHLVNKDGAFVRFILEDKDLDYPAGISVDKAGHLWICNSRYHKMLIVSYK